MFRVRAFRYAFSIDSPLACEGGIRDGSFTIQIGPSSITIPTVELGSDEWGEFAVIEEWECQLNTGFIVRVQPELDESNPEEPRFGCQISFTRPATLPPLIKDYIDRKGMTLDEVNMIIPPDSDFGLSFSYRGHFNGAYRRASPRNLVCGEEAVQ